MKLALGRILTLGGELGLRLAGPDALLRRGHWQHQFLTAPSMHIAGGTDEIQKNVVAERVLGLPREAARRPRRAVRQDPALLSRAAPRRRARDVDAARFRPMRGTAAILPRCRSTASATRSRFPPPEEADPSGLLAVGGDLSPDRLLLAYSNGIFPWPLVEQPLLWFSPDPRMVLRPARTRGVAQSAQDAAPRRLRGATRHRVPSRRAPLRRSAAPRRSGNLDHHRRWPTRTRACTNSASRTPPRRWQDGELVGGLYGVSLGQSFFGESMFADRPDASKVAFAVLVRQLARWGFDLIDCQVHTDHLARFGAREWTRRRFLTALQRSLSAPTRRGPWKLEAPEPTGDDAAQPEKPRAICSPSPTHWCGRCRGCASQRPSRTSTSRFATRALPFREYTLRYGRGPKEVVLVGMNPGPFGMAQTGVPFGEVGLVRDWLGDRRAGRQAGSRAPEAAGRGLRLYATRGLGPAAVGLRARSLREARALLRALLRRELLPAALPRSERSQPHARQTARRRARAARARLRSRAAPDHPAAATARRRGRRPLRRSARASCARRDSISRSAASRTRARRVPRRTAAGRSKPRAPSRS